MSTCWRSHRVVDQRLGRCPYIGKTLTVEVPDELYSYLQELSKGRTDREINEELVLLIKGFVEERRCRLNDPIFEPITTTESGLSDVSERHNGYLYDG